MITDTVSTLAPDVPSLPIQLIALDLDGTIVGQSNEIRDPIKQAIQAVQQQGVQVMIATGRMFCSALRFYQEIGCNLPLACYQGALIKDPTTETIHRHWSVPAPLVVDLLDYLEDPEWIDQISIHFYIDDQLYVREINETTEDYCQRSQIQPLAVGNLRSMSHREPTKVLVLSHTPEMSSQLLQGLQARYTPEQLYLTQSISTFLEATHPQVNKGEAVRYVAEELLGLAADQVMAIGDNFNDLEMLQYAGIGVAMADAPPGVKQVADFVVPGVEADGVVTAIEKFILNN